MSSPTASETPIGVAFAIRAATILPYRVYRGVCVTHFTRGVSARRATYHRQNLRLVLLSSGRRCDPDPPRAAARDVAECSTLQLVRHVLQMLCVRHIQYFSPLWAGAGTRDVTRSPQPRRVDDPRHLPLHTPCPRHLLSPTSLLRTLHDLHDPLHQIHPPFSLL